MAHLIKHLLCTRRGLNVSAHNKLSQLSEAETIALCFADKETKSLRGNGTEVKPTYLQKSWSSNPDLTLGPDGYVKRVPFL